MNNIEIRRFWRKRQWLSVACKLTEKKHINQFETFRADINKKKTNAKTEVRKKERKQKPERSVNKVDFVRQ